MPEPPWRNLPTLLVLPAPNVYKSWMLDPKSVTEDLTDQRTSGSYLSDRITDASVKRTRAGYLLPVGAAR
jgi:hypothetical protein